MEKLKIKTSDIEDETFKALGEPKENVLVFDMKICENTSDGYHTFKELYEHRITLFIALCKQISCDYNGICWKSKIHSDGSKIDGWFIMGINKEKGKQITYHLPMSKWDECDFVKTLEKAPEFDGHTAEDVLKRLKEL